MKIQSANADGRSITYDPERFSWTRRMEDAAKKGERLVYDGREVVLGSYRPFCKQWVYYDRVMNEMTYQQPRLFPLAESEGKKAERTYQQPNISSKTLEKGGAEMTYHQGSLQCLENRAISMVFGPRDFSCLMVDTLPDIQLSFNGQCFPLYWYEENGAVGGLFGEKAGGFTRHDAITDEALAVFREAYPHAFDGPNRRTIEQAKADGLSNAVANSEQRFEIAKVDIFYYVYGILHSPEYRERFASNLKKELPRIPLAEDFVAFCRAGRELAHLHLDYEEIEPWAAIEEDGDSVDPGRTVKMKFGKCKKSEENPKGQDMTVLHVAENMTLRNIPLEGYDYVVNGRSAIGWLMDRYQVKKDKASGIVNDPNEYSDDPRYIVDLVERVVTVSVRTMEIVRQLPALNEKGQTANWSSAWKVG